MIVFKLTSKYYHSVTGTNILRQHTSGDTRLGGQFYSVGLAPGSQPIQDVGMAEENHLDLKAIRKELGLSQTQFADLIGVSQRTVQSCEQGWRKPSPAFERAVLLLLLANRHGPGFGANICWDEMECPDEERKACLVYQSRQGHLCWLLTGNVCQGKRLRTWKDKKATCMKCDFFRTLIPEGLPTRGG
jgi:DNA-binding XRE family transcriptional regulator